MPIVIVPRHPLAMSDLRTLAHLLDVNVGAVRDASIRGEPIREFTAFGSNWDEERHVLARLWQQLTAGNAPFAIYDTENGSAELTADEFRSMLSHYRGIEVEQEMHKQLEIGAITSPSDFQPSEPDWTAPGTSGAA